MKCKFQPWDVLWSATEQDCILTHFSAFPFLELKREATARVEVRDKVKEEQSTETTVKKEPENQEHSEMGPSDGNQLQQ